MRGNNRVRGKELRKSLNLIIAAVTLGYGYFTIVGLPVGSSVFEGFMRSLGADDLTYSIVVALSVMGSVLQVFISTVLENTGKRKQIFLIFGFIHRLLWIPIAVLPLFIPLTHHTLIIWLITILIVISSTSHYIVGMAFYSWMGSLIPLGIRGRFFSKRTMFYTISGAIAGIAAGRFIDLNQDFKGFAIVFIIAALFGAADIFCFIWVKDPPMDKPKEKIPLRRLFAEPFKNRNYLRFIIFVTIWNFGVNAPALFFFTYMRQELQMSFFAIFALGQLIASISTVLSVRFWGRYIDRYGNKPVAAICCFFVMLLPFFWCFTVPSNYIILIPLMHVIAGIFWPGFDMTFMNMSIWLAPEKNRSIYTANYTMITSIVGISLAFAAGGFILKVSEPIAKSIALPFFLGQTVNQFHVLFLISGFIRAIAIFLFLPKVEEENAKSVTEILKRRPLPDKK
ncbi:MAG: MFS transporter [Clostridia bacterium]|nr:MFS transporter [Clostridia bacterium]